MTAPLRAKWKSAWIGTFATEEGEGMIPIMAEVRQSQTAVFGRRLTIGPADQDSDDMISTLSMGDWSGGGQIEELTGADQSRYWWGIFEGRSPRQAALPPLVSAYRPNSNCTKCWPLGVTGGKALFCFLESGTPKVWFFNEATKLFDYNGGAGVSITNEPVGKSLEYGGAVYVPCGANGYKIITDAGSGVPSVTPVAGADDPTADAATSNPKPVHFARGEGRYIFALTVTGGVAKSLTGAGTAWTWDYNAADEIYPRVDSGVTPYRLVPFFNGEGAPCLYVITSAGALQYDRGNKLFHETPIQFPTHPDVGRAAVVWRPGEDLWISLGLDTVRYTASNVAIPLSGVSRDASVPSDYRGTIVDLEPEISCLYALVAPYNDQSTWEYDSEFGEEGSGDDELDTPSQIAIDPVDGSIYVADKDNSRVKKYDSSGVYDSQVTGLTGCTGVCVDTNQNVYVVYNPGAGVVGVKKYNSSFGLQWTALYGSGSTGNHIAASTLHYYVTDSGNHRVIKGSLTDGVVNGYLGIPGSGDGQLGNPVGITYNPTTSTLFIVDQGNDRVQEWNTAGVFLRKWGGSGTGPGQFQLPVAICANPVNGWVFVSDSTRKDIQVFTAGGSYALKFGSSGTGDGQFTYPSGMGMDDEGNLWVSDQSQDRIQMFTAEEVATTPHLQAWSGIGWCGVWEGNTGVSPTYAKVMNVTSAYRLWWGADDGYAYTMNLRRSVHNPRTGILSQIDDFAPSGYIETSRADMGMLGFQKVASHVILFMREASSSERLYIQYEIDDGGWENFLDSSGNTIYVEQPGKNVMTFNNSLIDGVDSYSRGSPFNWIRFRINMERGSNTKLSPVIKAFNLHFLKVPQNSNSFQFTVPLPKRRWNGLGPADISDHLNGLLESGEMIFLRHQDRLYRGRLAQVTGVDATGRDFSGIRNISFIEVQTNEDA
jgi:hypothetical protein